MRPESYFSHNLKSVVQNVRQKFLSKTYLSSIMKTLILNIQRDENRKHSVKNTRIQAEWKTFLHYKKTQKWYVRYLLRIFYHTVEFQNLHWKTVTSPVGAVFVFSSPSQISCLKCLKSKDGFRIFHLWFQNIWSLIMQAVMIIVLSRRVLPFGNKFFPLLFYLGISYDGWYRSHSSQVLSDETEKSL